MIEKESSFAKDMWPGLKRFYEAEFTEEKMREWSLPENVKRRASQMEKLIKKSLQKSELIESLERIIKDMAKRESFLEEKTEQLEMAIYESDLDEGRI